ncbi:unnamed protein product [Knipowitschia caucasica]
MAEGLDQIRDRVRLELDRTVDFWLRFSHDTEYGGFFTCLDKDGQVYDDTKYVWLQGRQVWMYSRLYRTVPRFHTEQILEAAKAGGAFLRDHSRVRGSCGSWKCAFSLSRDGRALKVQRSIFSECFYIMGLDELSRVTRDRRDQLEAEQMMQQLLHWVLTDPSGLGRPQLPGDRPTSSLAVPMMVLCLVHQLTETREGAEAEEGTGGRGPEPEGEPMTQGRYRTVAEWCVQQIQMHVQRGGTAVLENVSEDGEELPGCAGRLLNPGHALEAGWFLLQQFSSRGPSELRDSVVSRFIEGPFLRGWDQEHGGLFYFLDVDGHCPTQLEWSMKLWWPHCEALVAFLMAFTQTRRPELLQRFTQIYDYTFKHFPDTRTGEWVGYLSREGNVALDFKGGPFKGFFHVPRCLLMCETMLDQILDQKQGPDQILDQD